jgi:hypothetical protein
MSTRDDNQAPFDWAPPIEREERRTPSPASTAGERQSIDTPEFRELLIRLLDAHEDGSEDEYKSARTNFIAHIDTWAARSAGDAVPAGWKPVPIEPTEDMITHGFECWPDQFFSKPEVWAAYEEMTGCQKAAHRARLCWAAMLGAAPAPGNTAKPSGKEE